MQVESAHTELINTGIYGKTYMIFSLRTSLHPPVIPSINSVTHSHTHGCFTEPLPGQYLNRIMYHCF